MASKTRPLYKSKYQRFYQAFWRTRIHDIWRACQMPFLHWYDNMIGESTLEDLPKSKNRATERFAQVNMDRFSSSVQLVVGYNYACVFVDCNTRYRWIYGMKLKREMLKLVKKWYSSIAVLRQKHKLLVIIKTNLKKSLKSLNWIDGN